MDASYIPYPAHDVVDVWWSDLDQAGQQNMGLVRTLGPDEIARATTMPADARCRFIGGRGLLRQILAAYTGTAATGIVLQHSQLGQPQLPANLGLSISLSHSGTLAVVAVVSHGAVGIDAEHRTRDIDLLAFRARVFTRNEWSAIRQLPSEEQHPAAIRIWVRKEAVLKAAGVGLSYSPRDIDVWSAAEQPIAFPTHRSTWLVTDLTMPDPGWVVAVAVSSNGTTPWVHSREWQGDVTPSEGRRLAC